MAIGPGPVGGTAQATSLWEQPWLKMFQAGVWMTVGLGVLLLPVRDWWNRRDAASIAVCPRHRGATQVRGLLPPGLPV